MSNTTDNYIAIRGKLPKRVEVALWTDKKIIAFLLFFEKFVTEGRIRCTIELRRQMELHCEEQPFWGEFMARIDVSTQGTSPAVALFTQRLITFSRTVLAYLKTEPHVVTDEMLQVMERNPRCHWALALVRMKKGIVAPTIAASDIEATDKYNTKVVANTSTKRPELMLHDSIIKAASLVREMMRGIKREDIKKMTVADKMKYGFSGMKLLGELVKKHTPNSQVFNQININSAKREDLEQAFMKYADSNMKANDK